MGQEKFKIAWLLLFEGKIQCKLKLLEDGILVIETGIPIESKKIDEINELMKGEFKKSEYWVIPSISEKGVMAMYINKNKTNGKDS